MEQRQPSVDGLASWSFRPGAFLTMTSGRSLPLAAGPVTRVYWPQGSSCGPGVVGRRAPESRSSSSVSWHSRQIQSLSGGVRALSSAGTIVTPQAGQIGGRSSYTFEGRL